MYFIDSKKVYLNYCEKGSVEKIIIIGLFLFFYFILNIRK